MIGMNEQATNLKPSELIKASKGPNANNSLNSSIGGRRLNISALSFKGEGEVVHQGESQPRGVVTDLEPVVRNDVSVRYSSRANRSGHENAEQKDQRGDFERPVWVDSGSNTPQNEGVQMYPGDDSVVAAGNASKLNVSRQILEFAPNYSQIDEIIVNQNPGPAKRNSFRGKDKRLLIFEQPEPKRMDILEESQIKANQSISRESIASQIMNNEIEAETNKGNREGVYNDILRDLEPPRSRSRPRTNPFPEYTLPKNVQERPLVHRTVVANQLPVGGDGELRNTTGSKPYTGVRLNDINPGHANFQKPAITQNNQNFVPPTAILAKQPVPNLSIQTVGRLEGNQGPIRSPILERGEGPIYTGSREQTIRIADSRLRGDWQRDGSPAILKHETGTGVVQRNSANHNTSVFPSQQALNYELASNVSAPIKAGSHIYYQWDDKTQEHKKYSIDRNGDKVLIGVEKPYFKLSAH
jgi:hypothetical protein